MTVVGVMRLQRPWQLLLCLSLCLISASTCSQAEQQLVVVASKDAAVQQLSRQQVMDIFLGEEHEGIELEPLDRNEFAIKRQFYRDLTGMSLNRLRAYWAKKVFTSRGRPPRVISLRRLQQQGLGEQAITYMYANNVMDDVKIVYQLETGHLTETEQ